MKQLRKLLVAFVVISMLVTAIMPTFAADTATSSSITNADAAKKLYDLKLFKGLSSTEYVPGLDLPLNRETGAIMILRIVGQEQKALDATTADLSKFPDAAKVSDWAKKQVAYATQQGYLKGFEDGTFRPQDSLTGNQFATIILRVLGYEGDFAFAEATKVLGGKIGMSEADISLLASKALTRGDLVGMAFKSVVNGTYKADGMKVIDRLVKDGILSASDVANVLGSDYANLSVVSVKANNPREVEVQFSRPVDVASAGDASKYRFFGISDTGDDKAAQYAEVLSDGVTVRLVVPRTDGNNDDNYGISDSDKSAELQILNVKSADLSKNYSTDSDNKEAIDISDVDHTTAPTVESISIISPHEMAVVYSEAVVDTTPGATDGRNSALNPGAYAIIDGNSSYRLVSGDENDEYYAEISNPSGDLRTFVIDLPNHEMLTDQVMSINAMANKYTSGGEDYTNQKISDTTESENYVTSVKAQNVEVLNDEQRPTIQSVGIVSRTKLLLTFSEPVDMDNLASNKSGIKWTTSSTSRSAKSVEARTLDQAYVTFDSSNAIPTSGDFRVTVEKKDVKDLYGNEMASDFSTTLTGRSDDEITATAAQKSDSQREIEVTFSEKMDQSSMRNSSNYKVDGKKVDSAVIDGDDERVVTIKASADLTNGSHEVTINGVKDQYGNAINITVSVTTDDETAPTVTVLGSAKDQEISGYSENKDVIVLQYSEEMKTSGEGSVVDVNNYRLVNGDVNIRDMKDSQNLLRNADIKSDNDGRTVRIILPKNTLNDIATLKLYVIRYEGSTVIGPQDLAGNTLSNDSDYVSSGYKGYGLIVNDLATSIRAAATNWGTDFTAYVSGTYEVKVKVKPALIGKTGFLDMDTSSFVATKVIGSKSYDLDIDSIELQDKDGKDNGGDGINEIAVFKFDNDADKKLSDATNVKIELKDLSEYTEDIYGTQILQGTINTEGNDSEAELQVTEAKIVNDKTIRVTFSTAVDIANKQDIMDSLEVDCTTKNSNDSGKQSITNVTAADSNGLKFDLVLGVAMDTTSPVHIKITDPTLRAKNGASLQVTTDDGILAEDLGFVATLVAGADAVMDGTDAYYFDASDEDNASSIALTFSKAYDRSSIDSDWTNGEHFDVVANVNYIEPTGAAGQGYFDLDIPGIGTIGQFRHGTAQAITWPKQVRLTLTATSAKVLTMTLSADQTGLDSALADGLLLVVGDVVEYVPSGVEDLSANSVNTDEKPTYQQVAPPAPPAPPAP